MDSVHKRGDSEWHIPYTEPFIADVWNISDNIWNSECKSKLLILESIQ
jgi:hypothetical protein